MQKTKKVKTVKDILYITRKPKIGKTYAISIGINNYPSPHTLSVARQDAESFHKFAVEKLDAKNNNSYLLVDQNATREGIMTAFDSVGRKVKPEDSLIVLIAGHGIIEKRGDSEESYFVPSDGKWDRLFGTAIRMPDFDAMLRMKAKRVLVIADACFSSSLIKIRGVNDVFSKITGEGRIIIGYNRPAQEDMTLGHGYLTYYMLEGLKGPADENGDGKIAIREAYEYVNNQVKKKTGSGIWIQGEGDLDLVRVSQ